MPSILTTKPEFPEILSVIKEYLEKQKAVGEPARIHFLDTNHYTSTSMKVIADKSLHELVKQYGNPVYVLESINGAEASKLVQDYISGDKKALTPDSGVTDNKALKNASLIEIANYASQDQKTRILFPDTRVDDLERILTNAPKDQREAFEKFSQNFGTEVDRVFASRRGMDRNNPIHIEEAQIVALNIMLRSFNEQERNSFLAVRGKIAQALKGDDLLDTSAIDEKISSRVLENIRDHDVQLTIYGAAHFDKKNDLNDRMPGLSIAIVDKDKTLAKVLMSDEFGRHVHNQFPDYAYYADQHKITKLDNDKAKAEYLGMDEKQFKAWELSIKVREEIINKLPSSPVETSPTAPQPYQQPAPIKPGQLGLN
ncbi:MAG: hypothetical protein AABY33_08905 [Pseudomonadota bacterium]